MKFNTKTMSPLVKVAPTTATKKKKDDSLPSSPPPPPPSSSSSSSDSIFYHPNKFLSPGVGEAPFAHQQDEEQEQEQLQQQQQQQLGSWIRFLPTIVYTPVKSSFRTNSRHDTTLDVEGVVDLNKAFQRLLITNQDAHDVDDDDDVEAKQEEEKEEKENVSVSQPHDHRNTLVKEHTNNDHNNSNNNNDDNKNDDGDNKEALMEHEKLGRFKTTALHRKMREEVPVMRSYRLVQDDDDDDEEEQEEGDDNDDGDKQKQNN